MNKEKNSGVQIPCKNLRSKEMYYQELGREDDPYPSGIFWCVKTQENVGPDNEAVGKIECCPGRSCYIH